jgi:hypothetical protein
MSPRDVMGNRGVKYYGKADTEWNCNTKESDSFLHKSKQQPSRYHLGITNDWRLMEPRGELVFNSSYISGVITELDGFNV